MINFVMRRTTEDKTLERNCIQKYQSIPPKIAAVNIEEV